MMQLYPDQAGVLLQAARHLDSFSFVFNGLFNGAEDLGSCLDGINLPVPFSSPSCSKVYA
jgi:hypothetical protein